MRGASLSSYGAFVLCAYLKHHAFLSCVSVMCVAVMSPFSWCVSVMCVAVMSPVLKLRFCDVRCCDVSCS